MGRKQTTTLQQKLGKDVSPLQAYRLSVVGSKGYLQLLIFELINFMFIPLGGKSGQLLRKITFPLLLGKMGKKVVVGTNCTIRNGSRISIKDRVHIGKDVTLHLDGHSADNTITIGNDVRINDRTILKSSGGTMDIGANTQIGSSCRIGSLKGLTIGKNCFIGNKVSIAAASHSFTRSDIPINQQPLTCKGKIVIGEDTVIGNDTTILDGVHIGKNVTIHPGTLVNKNISDGTTVAGIPAKDLNK